MGLVVYLSLTPTPPTVPLGKYADKWEHVAAYASLMWWFCQLQLPMRQRLRTALLLISLGIALEFVQRATGVRTFEVADMIAGGTGVILGWLLAPPRTANLLGWCQRRLASPAGNPRGR